MPNPTFLEPQSPEESTYHFKIRVPNGPIENAKRYGSKIDNFLDDIFNIGTSPRVDAPLEFEEREMVADGCKSVLVKLKLSDSGEARGISFDNAIKVLALSFATVAGVNVLGYKSAEWSDNKAVKTFGPAGIAIATSILEKISEEKKKTGPKEITVADRQRRWADALREFNTSMKQVLRAVNYVTYPTKDSPHQHEESYGELAYACYEATLSAGLALVMNEDIFKAYVKLRNDAAKEMVKNAATAAICLTNIGSAFALSTSYSVLPIAEWSLGQAASWFFLGEVPVIATTTVMINPVLAGVVLIGTGIAGVWSYKSRQEKKKFEKRVKYHKDMAPLLSRAWGLAEETRTFLEWVYCTDSKTPTDAEFVNEAAKARWSSFIRAAKEKLGQSVNAGDLDAKHVIEYLRVQRDDFEKWQKRMDVQKALADTL